VRRLDVWKVYPLSSSGCKVSDQSIRSRRSELVRRGRVQSTGVRRRTDYGRMAAVWPGSLLNRADVDLIVDCC
jgi:hypothetical protein